MKLCYFCFFNVAGFIINIFGFVNVYYLKKQQDPAPCGYRMGSNLGRAYKKGY